MSARNYLQAIGAGATARLPGGRYFFVKQATSAITITTQGLTGAPARFENIGAGSKFGPIADGWTFLDVFSAGAQTIEVIISDDGLFEVANAVTVSGVAQTAELPSSALADTVDNAQASGTETTIAANPLRRRITIGVLSTAGNGVRVSAAGGTNTRGVEIQPGTFAEFRTTAALFVRNANIAADASASAWYSLEET